jgi:phage-related minor tail protein
MSSKVDQNENRHVQDLEVDREGINSLAAWQSLDPDKESLIYRKFGYLSARRSLHLQNKLLDLEDQLEDLDAKVRQGDTEARKSLRKHEIFEQRSTRKDSIDEQRMILLDKIDAALNKYCMYVA